LLASGILSLSARGQSVPRPLQTSDLLDVREIREVTLSPSGRNVAYTVRRVVSEAGGSSV